ncbi:hypothetical protein VSS37_03225 [Candidatus Thiothrix sp. Deng01]|uniref:Uncharacterized protein n=1 Tax=Candidatus Thiothrix phosphatis TaxID=3112415 RepID=A0ABU6CT26_9GAMM|nr:hypothetical protein [Candidatus Thiothrix sp. Deng01]MEB4589981.1 hypothetical protein [Candidatus Thiothrix sp. Deng01]
MSSEQLKDALDELASLKQSAMDAAETFKEGVEAVAKKHAISKGAISKYVTARLADKLGKLEEETSDLETLLNTVSEV